MLRKGRVKLLNSVDVVAMELAIMRGLGCVWFEFGRSDSGTRHFDVARRLIRGGRFPVATRNGMNVEVSAGCQLPVAMANGCADCQCRAGASGKAFEMRMCKRGKGRSDYERKSQDYRLTLSK